MKKKKVTFSPFLNSYITPVFKLTNNIWFFKRCNNKGEVYGKIFKAGTKYNYFNWIKI